MSTFTASLRYLKSNKISLIEKYFGQEILQPNLVNLAGIGRILVIKNHDSISDYLMAAPVFSALRQAFPKAHIGALVHPAVQGLARLNAEIDEVIVASDDANIAVKDFAKICWGLRKKWDLAIALNTEFHALISDLFAYYSGAKYILGSAGRLFPGTQRNFMYNLLAPLWPEHLHRSQKNLDILSYLGIENNAAMKNLVLPQNQLSRARSELEKNGYSAEKPLIGIHLGSGKLFGTWPIGRLAELTRTLHKKYDAQIALFWNEKEAEKARQFLSYVQFNLLKIAPQKLTNLACFMHLCDAMVFNDSWATHLCAAVNTPQVVIFGPTDPAEFKPVGSPAIAIRGKKEKADNITVAQVEEALIALLERKPCAENGNQHDTQFSPVENQSEPSLDNLDISENILDDFRNELLRAKWQVQTAEVRTR